MTPNDHQPDKPNGSKQRSNLESQRPGSAGSLPAPPPARSNPSIKNRIPSVLQYTILLALPIALCTYLFATHPFRHEIVCRIFSLVPLNPSQQENIRVASRALNGCVLKPGDEFSFNRVVGPRTDGRGYRPAASYLEKGSPQTTGGGICLLSSALYQAALASGLRIESRTPHTRTIASVEPGLDATVWYGGADLKFINSSTNPILINAECKNNNLYIRLLGEQDARFDKTAQLKTFITSRNHNELLVEVFRDVDGKRNFVSRDHYQINR